MLSCFVVDAWHLFTCLSSHFIYRKEAAFWTVTTVKSSYLIVKILLYGKLCHLSLVLIPAYYTSGGCIISEWLQFVVCPVNQIEDGVTTRKKDTTHFVYRTGLVSDESILYVFFRGPHRNGSVFLWIYIFTNRALHFNLV